MAVWSSVAVNNYCNFLVGMVAQALWLMMWPRALVLTSNIKEQDVGHVASKNSTLDGCSLIRVNTLARFPAGVLLMVSLNIWYSRDTNEAYWWGCCLEPTHIHPDLDSSLIVGCSWKWLQFLGKNGGIAFDDDATTGFSAEGEWGSVKMMLIALPSIAVQPAATVESDCDFSVGMALWLMISPRVLMLRESGVMSRSKMLVTYLDSSLIVSHSQEWLQLLQGRDGGTVVVDATKGLGAKEDRAMSKSKRLVALPW